MSHRARQGLIGLMVGIIGGVIAALLLAPRRKEVSGSAIAGLGQRIGAPAALQRVTRRNDGARMLPDERITVQLRDTLEERGMWSGRVDVTTIDGVVYLRGREPDTVRADNIVAAAYSIPGVKDVIDEVRREG